MQRAEESLVAEKLRWKQEKDNTRKISEALREAENARCTSCRQDLVHCFALLSRRLSLPNSYVAPLSRRLLCVLSGPS